MSGILSKQAYAALLEPAFEQAEIGFSEGGVPVGAALFDASGDLLSVGRNRRVQENDPSIHGETDAFRRAGRQSSYRDKILVTTLAPCWYCSGLIRQFNIGTVVVGESVNFEGHLDWLREARVQVVELNDARCISLMASFIQQSPDIWNEDIGECACDSCC
ncbi:nucleoside deaminase [Thiomicrorhabdus aquaedulcis]|uniref:nucleoside deaminase n=1 Tax=Thiomicrorhabdus aquaedulcis TaxID=2211106 RepID=UPI000FD9E359|nr:nucleoside deaminase [Thiomicrorhabdus aquaedulcis]